MQVNQTLSMVELISRFRFVVLPISVPVWMVLIPWIIPISNWWTWMGMVCRTRLKLNMEKSFKKIRRLMWLSMADWERSLRIITIWNLPVQSVFPSRFLSQNMPMGVWLFLFGSLRLLLSLMLLQLSASALLKAVWLTLMVMVLPTWSTLRVMMRSLFATLVLGQPINWRA